jgi:hypothetical protein
MGEILAVFGEMMRFSITGAAMGARGPTESACGVALLGVRASGKRGVKSSQFTKRMIGIHPNRAAYG